MKTRPVKIIVTPLTRNWTLVDAETTVNGKTWIVKAVKPGKYLKWKSFEVFEKRTLSRLDPHSEVFETIRDAITSAFFHETSVPGGDPALPYELAGQEPFDLQTRAFLSKLIESLSGAKEQRLQDFSNAETPLARLMAGIGAEALEDAINMIRVVYMEYAHDPILLETAISSRRIDEAQGKTEL